VCRGSRRHTACRRGALGSSTARGRIADARVMALVERCADDRLATDADAASALAAVRAEVAVVA